MDSTDLSNLVGRLERQSDYAPQVYVAKVTLVAAVGYTPVVLLAVFILVCAWFMIASLLSQGHPYILSLLGLIGGGAILVAVVRALLVRGEEPAGRQISREETPALFAALDEATQKMAAASKKAGSRSRKVSFDTVRLNREFDTRICQVPGWGVFGSYRNHLQIGVPVLAALNIAEFKAVLAHEIGHLGTQHNAFSASIYRQRTTWQLLQRKLEKPASIVEHLLAVFYRWYAPYFHAYTFVLARNHEYAADRAAAQATHARVLARALTKLVLVGRFLAEIFWKRLFDQVEKVPEPRYLPYAMMPRALDVAQKEWLRKDWLHDSMRTFPTDGDTHPSLSERLAALDVPPELPSHSSGASALALLGANHTAVLQWCDTEWEQENAAAWRKKHETIREARWKLSQYETMPAAELQAEGIWEKSVLLLDLGQDHDAIEVLQELVARHDALPKAHLQLGRLLLEYGDEHGLQNLTLAGQRDPDLLETAGQVGYGYLMDRGRRGEAQRFWERLQAG